MQLGTLFEQGLKIKNEFEQHGCGFSNQHGKISFPCRDKMDASENFMTYASENPKHGPCIRKYQSHIGQQIGPQIGFSDSKGSSVMGHPKTPSQLQNESQLNLSLQKGHRDRCDTQKYFP